MRAYDLWFHNESNITIYEVTNSRSLLIGRTRPKYSYDRARDHSDRNNRPSLRISVIYSRLRPPE